MQNPQDVQLAARTLSARLPKSFQAASGIPGIVLGTGLSHFVKSLEADEKTCRIPFSELPGFPQSSAPSHDGAFIYGEFAGRPVFVQSGRLHLYEGHNPAQVCMPIRVMAALGIKTVVLTNAAGSLNPLFASGNLMCIADMINHTGMSPLRGPNHDAWGPRFPDMCQVFDARLQKLACDTALELGLPLYRGVYLGLAGPELETPAEIRMYRQWGADAVGMSTVLEAICGRHLNLALLGISSLTNQNLPDNMRQPVTISDILSVAQQCSKSLERLLAALVGRL